MLTYFLYLSVKGQGDNSEQHFPGGEDERTAEKMGDHLEAQNIVAGKLNWRKRIAWVALGIALGVGGYAVVDHRLIPVPFLSETECERFDRRCAVFNNSATSWEASMICGLTGLLTVGRGRPEGLCAELNAELDEVDQGSSDEDQQPSRPLPLELTGWSGSPSSSSQGF